jgi:hypothetical protein
MLQVYILNSGFLGQRLYFFSTLLFHVTSLFNLPWFVWSLIFMIVCPVSAINFKASKKGAAMT